MKALAGGWVPLVFLVSAVALFVDPLPYRDVLVPPTVVESWATDPTTVRQPELTPRYPVGGYTYRCSDCHNILPSPAETHRTLGQHKEIQLRHGINTRCFNCHHRTNRNAFVDDMGGEIPWDQPQLLCAKCHGPVYRDWEAGSHGRSNGYWDTAQGSQTRRRCIECHDPHVPPFPGMEPAPGPNTLRMGAQTPAHGAGERNPLRLPGAKPPAANSHH